MSSCDIIPLTPPKACTGKCASACASAPRLWVLAACEGMMALYEKTRDLGLVRLDGSHTSPFCAMEPFRDFIADASKKLKFQQLIIVGSANDLPWAQAMLPENVAKKVVAEIPYPLMPSWFRTAQKDDALVDALNLVLKA